MSVPLVNTSLPARQAVPLPPATLASLTGKSSTADTGFLRSLRRSNEPTATAIETDPTPKPKGVWASLAAKWGQEQKEEEQRRREEEKQHAHRAAEIRRQREAEEKERTKLGITRALMERTHHTLLDEEEAERRRRLERLAAEDDTRQWVEETDPRGFVEDAEDWEHRRKSKHDF